MEGFIRSLNAVQFNMELLTESEMAEKHKAFAVVNSKSSADISYYLLHATKHSEVLSEYNSSSQNKNFLETSQMLWSLRNNPSYYAYPDAQPSHFFTKNVGLRIPDIPSEELENMNDSMRKRASPYTDFSDMRSLISGWNVDEQKFNESWAFVYIPSPYTDVTPGLLTDLVFAFRKKADKLPRLNDQGQEVYLTDWRFTRKNNSNSLTLLTQGILLPHLQADDLGTLVSYYQPTLCTPENMRKYVQNAIGHDRPAEEIEQRVAREFNILKEYSISPLKDVIGSARQFIQDVVPERYERFNRAISSNQENTI